MTIQGKRPPGSSPPVARLLGDELGAGGITYAQQVRAANVVFSHVAGDAERRRVLEALFRPIRHINLTGKPQRPVVDGSGA
jgi:hypothetical protein